jgi:3-isopropylmalate/(R)-2-methylmalate dehydratase large subunit
MTTATTGKVTEQATDKDKDKMDKRRALGRGLASLLPGPRVVPQAAPAGAATAAGSSATHVPAMSAGPGTGSARIGSGGEPGTEGAGPAAAELRSAGPFDSAQGRLAGAPVPTHSGKAPNIGVPAVKPGDAGFARTDLRFSHEYVTPMAAIFFDQLVGRDVPVNDPASIVFFRDHLTFLDEVLSEQKRKMGLLDLATQLKLKQRDFAERKGIRLHGELTDRKGSEGICHSVILESYALPGQLVVGSDSHTPHSGAIGCVAFGIGTTDVFNSWITKDVRVRVPESVRVVIRGKKRANVTAKDLMLKILSLDYVRSGKALAKVIEYAGEAIEELSVDERATMTNMAAEIGGFTGIVAPDRKAIEFLVERRGMSREQAEQMIDGLYSDPDAEYAHVIELDANDIAPMIATPGDPGNGKFIRDLNTPVPVELAYGGTCTAGKNEDMDMYARVLEDALQQGKRVADSVQFYIQFGSQETRDYCMRRGYLEVFQKAGAHMIEPSCGACINAGPGVSTRPDQVVISAQNRNFPGRSGPGQMYLASPLTVAASAVAGYIVEYEPSSQRELMPA